MKVYCYPVSRESAYVPLIFAGTAGSYRPVFREDGTLEDALARARAGERAIVHVHWEEFVLRECATEEEAAFAAAAFARSIAALREQNVALVWTVHNEVPHSIAYPQHFLALRRLLARTAEAILVHDEAAIDVLRTQAQFDRSRVHVLPHPSYLGIYESEASLLASLREPFERRIACFGWIRRQKGYGEMIEMLPLEFLRSRGTWIGISGDGPEAPALIAEQAHRPDVVWDVRHVPDAEAPRLLRTALCVALPYERGLTSGVALLAMSAGALVVAVDLPQIRAALPEPSRRFLYPRGDGKAFREAIDGVLALDLDERAAIVRANLAAARDVHPRVISRRLAAIYDALVAACEGTERP